MLARIARPYNEIVRGVGGSIYVRMSFLNRRHFCLAAGTLLKPVSTPEAIWHSGPAAEGTYPSSIKCPA